MLGKICAKVGFFWREKLWGAFGLETHCVLAVHAALWAWADVGLDEKIPDKKIVHHQSKQWNAS